MLFFEPDQEVESAEGSLRMAFGPVFESLSGGGTFHSFVAVGYVDGTSSISFFEDEEALKRRLKEPVFLKKKVARFSVWFKKGFKEGED